MKLHIRQYIPHRVYVEQLKTRSTQHLLSLSLTLEYCIDPRIYSTQKTSFDKHSQPIFSFYSPMFSNHFAITFSNKSGFQFNQITPYGVFIFQYKHDLHHSVSSEISTQYFLYLATVYCKHSLGTVLEALLFHIGIMFVFDLVDTVLKAP